MEKMKKILGLAALALSTATMAAPAQWLTVDNQVLAKIAPKLNKSVQTVFTGEGATSEGDFHEACNLAGVQRAPVVFLGPGTHVLTGAFGWDSVPAALGVDRPDG